MAKLVGSVDHRGRPVVRVAVAGCEDEVLATIDTGFNGQVMVVAGDAASVGVHLRDGGESHLALFKQPEDAHDGNRLLGAH